MQETSENKVGILVRGISISVVGKLLGRGGNFLTQVILARYLGPEIFGLFAIGWALLRIISLIGPGGLDQGVIRFGLKYWPSNRSEFRAVWFISIGGSLTLGLILGTLLYFSSSFIANEIFKKPDLSLVLMGMAFAMPFTTVLRVLSTSMTITKSTKYSILAEEIGQPFCELLLIGIGLIFHLTLLKAVTAATLSFVLAVGLALIFSIRLFPELLEGFPKISGNLLATVVRFSIPAAFASLFGALISWVDRLMVGFFLDEANTGIYATVSLMSVLFVTILSGLKTILSPLIADLYHQGEIDKLAELYKVSTKWGCYIGIPIILVVFIAPYEIITVVFGQEYAGGATALFLLTTAQLVNLITGALDLVLVMTGHHREWLLISAVMFFLNIVLNSLLIPLFGINGAAFGTAITVIGVFAYGIFWVRRVFGFWPYDRRFLKVVYLALFVITGLLIVKYIGINGIFTNLIVMTGVAFAIFWAGLIIAGLDKEDHEFLRVIKKRFSC